MSGNDNIPEQRRARRGFTLVELLLVVTILGILAAVVVVNFTGKGEEARIAATRTSIANIGVAIAAFDAKNSRLPETLDELTSEDEKGVAMLKKDSLNDSWGHPFQYKKTGYKYELRSAGPSGQMGGNDNITN